MSIKLYFIKIFCFLYYFCNINVLVSADGSNNGYYDCYITLINPNLGNLVPHKRTPTTITSTIAVSCKVSDIAPPHEAQNIKYNITFSDNNSSEPLYRLLHKDYKHAVHYNIYQDPFYTKILGSGLNGTYTYANAYQLLKGETRTDNYIIYLKIPAARLLSTAGLYRDKINININY